MENEDFHGMKQFNLDMGKNTMDEIIPTPHLDRSRAQAQIQPGMKEEGPGDGDEGKKKKPEEDLMVKSESPSKASLFHGPATQEE